MSDVVVILEKLKEEGRNYVIKLQRRVLPKQIY